MLTLHPQIITPNPIWLVVGNVFSIYWEYPNWRTHIFQRDRYTTNQPYITHQALQFQVETGRTMVTSSRRTGASVVVLPGAADGTGPLGDLTG